MSHGRRNGDRSSAGAAQADHHAQEGNVDCGLPRLLKEISTLLCYEVTRDLELTTERIETPLVETDAPVLEGKKLVFASILRAGNGLLEGMLELVPSARVAHIGVYRDHETLQAVEYFFKAPDNINERLVIVVDPMLATGNSAIAAIEKLKERGARNIRFLCLLAAPEGIRNFQAPIRTCRSSRPRSTAISTRRAISCRASAMRATACTERSRAVGLPSCRLGKRRCISSTSLISCGMRA